MENLARCGTDAGKPIRFSVLKVRLNAKDIAPAFSVPASLSVAGAAVAPPQSATKGKVGN
jgi:hypothetical protein